MYIYIYTFIYICIYLYTYSYIYMCIDISVYIYLYFSMYIRKYTHSYQHWFRQSGVWRQPSWQSVLSILIPPSYYTPRFVDIFCINQFYIVLCTTIYVNTAFHLCSVFVFVRDRRSWNSVLSIFVPPLYYTQGFMDVDWYQHIINYIVYSMLCIYSICICACLLVVKERLLDNNPALIHAKVRGRIEYQYIIYYIVYCLVYIVLVFVRDCRSWKSVFSIFIPPSYYTRGSVDVYAKYNGRLWNILCLYNIWHVCDMIWCI